MVRFMEMRKYKRSSAGGRAMMSFDKNRWEDIEYNDISAGGFRFLSDKSLDLNGKLYFEFSLHNALSEFHMHLEGIMVRKEIVADGFLYGVRFVNISPYHQTQLDEIIRASESQAAEEGAAPDDGMYSFLFVPRNRRHLNQSNRMFR